MITGYLIINNYLIVQSALGVGTNNKNKDVE